MGEDLFGDLPPPSHHQTTPTLPDQLLQQQQQIPQPRKSIKFASEPHEKPKPNNPDLLPLPLPLPLPPPPLKSALKRPQRPDSTQPPNEGGSGKRLRFKTITDTSVTQIVEAMQKIASHIKNPAKFNKASKLAIQLIQSGSVKPETVNHFYAILEAAMLSSILCNDASVRSDYHALFSAAQDASALLDKHQKNQLNVWVIRAVVANDLYTDDSFVFSKTAGRIKDLISDLPVATVEEDVEEAAALKDEKDTASGKVQSIPDEISSDQSGESTTKEECDPFGLDALISPIPKKDDKAKGKKGREEEEEEETKKFLKLQREALINCLEIAAKRYKIPWCQTVIDILVKHAYDNVSRFTAQQRDAIEKLWASIREQHTRRKQGKSVSGKLDVTAFEFLQEKYSHEKISIRHAVGGGGERKCLQWLG